MNVFIMNTGKNHSRRSFLKGTATLAGSAFVSGLPLNARAAKPGILRLGLVGCGRRGTGAAFEALQASKSVKLVAMGDTFEDMLSSSYSSIAAAFKDQVDVPSRNRFVGFDAYQKVMDACDVVLLATPPPFRPGHFEAAVKAGKHVFMEKPVAVDVPGFHKIIEIGKLAEQKKLNVVVGLQRRYHPATQEMLKKIHEGAIGPIRSLDVYYNVGAPKIHPRVSAQTEMEYQLRNWRYFSWLWGGQIAGQAIHQVDTMNWLMQDYPVIARGSGGRQTFEGPNQGNTYDHFYVEYIYPNGVKMHLQCKNMDNCWKRMGFEIHGAAGYADERNRIFDLKGNIIWRHREREDTPGSTQLEQNALINAILEGGYINNTEYGAQSSLTTIIGRMAVHSGQELKLEEVLKSTIHLGPTEYAWNASMPDLPGEDGNYAVPIPGKTKVL